MGEVSQILIAQLRADMSVFTRDLRQGLGEVQSFSRRSAEALERIEKSNQQVVRSTQRMSASFGQLRNLIIGLGLTQLAREGFELAKSFDSIQRTLVATTGGVRQAAEAYAFVREESRRLGTNLIAGARAFGDMSDAARGTSIEGQGVKTIFSGLGATITALGLGNERFKSSLIAINQILDRTKIQTQEVNQLTEAGIPIRRTLTEIYKFQGDELDKALEKGIIPAEALEAVFGRLLSRFQQVSDETSQTTAIAFSTLGSTVQETSAQFFSAILRSEELNTFIRSLTTTVGDFSGIVKQSGITEFVDQVVRLVDASIRGAASVKAFFESIKPPPLVGPGGPEGNLPAIQDALRKILSTDIPFIDLGLSEKAIENLVQLIAGSGGATQQIKALTDVIDDLSGHDRELADFFDQFDKGSTFITELGESAGEAATQTQTLDSKLKALEERLRNQLLASAEAKEAEKEAERAAKKSLRIAEKAAEDAHEIRKDSLEREMEQRFKHDEQIVEADIALYEKREKLAAEAAENIHQRNVTALEKEIAARLKRDEDEVNAREARFNKEVAERERTFERVADNLQDIFADTISTALKGDLDSIQDFFEAINDLAKDTAGQIAAAFILEPAIKKAKENIAAGLGGSATTTAALLAGAGLVGTTAAGAAGAPGVATSVIGGVASGAATGALLAAPAGGIGAPVGAIIGGVVGGLLAAAPHLFGGGGEKVSQIAVQTTATRPGVTSDNAATQGAFGVISLDNERSKRANAQAIANSIAEFDRAIFQSTSARQRELIEATLQAPINNTLIGEGVADTDQALAEVIAQRGKLIIESLAGAAVAETVVGSTEDADISVVAKRVEDALAILGLIEDIGRGEQSDAANLIRAISEEFDNLISRAEEFGIATAELEEERQRRIAKVGEDVNKDIAQRTLELLDPAAAAHAALAERQRIEYENTRDANADLIALERLHALERDALAKEIAESNAQIKESNREGLLKSIDDFIHASRQLTPVQQEIHGVTVQFIELRNEARLLGESTSQLEAAFHRRLAQIREEARLTRILSVATGGSGDTRSQIEQVFRAFVGAGRTLNPLAQQLEDLRHEYARLAYAAQLAGRSTADLRQSYLTQIQQLVTQAKDSVISILETFESPFTQAKRQIERQLKEIAELVAEGLVPPHYLVGLERRVRAGAAIDEALRRIGGGALTPIEQVADSFDTFIRAGSPLSQTGQELAAVTENFRNLISAAHLLGLSTTELEESYAKQSKTIRERLIADIEQQLSTQIQAIKSINALLDSFDIADTLPGNLRLDAAQRQFQEALGTGDAQQIIQAANQLREIARGQFGSAAGFFAIQNQIEEALRGFRDSQQSFVDTERERLLKEAQLEQERILQGGNSLDVLKIVANDGSATARGIAELIKIAQQSLQLDAQTQRLLEQTGTEQSRDFQKQIDEALKAIRDWGHAQPWDGAPPPRPLYIPPGGYEPVQATPPGQFPVRPLPTGGSLQPRPGAGIQVLPDRDAWTHAMSNQTQQALDIFREQQVTQAESERRRWADQVARDEERNALARSSLTVLERVSTDQHTSSVGIVELLKENKQLRGLLERMLATSRR